MAIIKNSFGMSLKTLKDTSIFYKKTSDYSIETIFSNTYSQIPFLTTVVLLYNFRGVRK